MEPARSSEDPYLDSLLQSRITQVPDPNASGSANAALLNMSDLSIFSSSIELQGLADFNPMSDLDISLFPNFPQNSTSSSSIPTMSSISSVPAATSTSNTNIPTYSLQQLENFQSSAPQQSFSVNSTSATATSKSSFQPTQTHSSSSSASSSPSSSSKSSTPSATKPFKPRKMTREEKDNANPQTTSDGKPRKHIRRACLECRKRHIRCDGVLPICKKCQDNNRTCNYVPSHRGGLRIPKNKQKLQESAQDVRKPFAYASPCMLDTILNTATSSSNTVSATSAPATTTTPTTSTTTTNTITTTTITTTPTTTITTSTAPNSTRANPPTTSTSCAPPITSISDSPVTLGNRKLKKIDGESSENVSIISPTVQNSFSGTHSSTADKPTILTPQEAFKDLEISNTLSRQENNQHQNLPGKGNPSALDVELSNESAIRDVIRGVADVPPYRSHSLANEQLMSNITSSSYDAKGSASKLPENSLSPSITSLGSLGGFSSSYELNTSSSTPNSSCGVSSTDNTNISSGNTKNSTLADGVDPLSMSLDTIVDGYYSSFHNRHPLLPPRNKFYSYIQNIRPTQSQENQAQVSGSSSDPCLSNELVMAMAYIVHVFTLARPPVLEELSPHIQRAFEAIQRAPDDIIKVQASLVLLFGAHLATENSVSVSLRAWLFSFLYKKLSVFNLSSPVPESDNTAFPVQGQNGEAGGYVGESDTIAGGVNSNVLIGLFSSPRTENLDHKLVLDAISRSVHEAFFLEILFSLIGRTPLTRFSLSGVVDSVPLANVNGFAYCARYRTVKVAKSILQTLSTVGSSLQSSTEFSRLEALTTTFQGFLQEGSRDTLNSGVSSDSNGSTLFPPLVNDFGTIDDGIHQAMIIINFGAIILHFSFSNLYQNRIPSYVECTESAGPAIGSQQRPAASKYRATMCTRKCIEAANSLIQIVSDVGMQQINQRTPLYSCALSMAMLVHMKAYHWLVTSFSSPPAGILGKEVVQRLIGETPGSATWGSFRNPPTSRHHHHPDNEGAMTTLSAENEMIRQSEINLYEAYIKLESNTLKMFSRRWILPGKLNTSLCNVMFSVLPELYENTVETRIRPKRKTGDIDDDYDNEDSKPARKAKTIERDCWMKNLDLNTLVNSSHNSNASSHNNSTESLPMSGKSMSENSLTQRRNTGSSLSSVSTGFKQSPFAESIMMRKDSDHIDNDLSGRASAGPQLLGSLGDDSNSGEPYNSQIISLDDIPAELGLDIFDQLFDLDNLAATANLNEYGTDGTVLL